MNGLLYFCRDEKGELYAMKVFEKNHEQYLHEVNLYKMLSRHVNIVALVDTICKDEERILILEYCHQSLSSFLKQGEIDEKNRLRLFAQLVSAFRSIHEDLKGSGMVF